MRIAVFLIFMAAMLCLLSLSALLFAAHTALANLSEHDMHLCKQRTDNQAQRICVYYEQSHRFFAYTYGIILCIDTIVFLCLTNLGVCFYPSFSLTAIIAMAFAVFCGIVIFTKLLPYNVAKKNPLLVAYRTIFSAKVIRFVSSITKNKLTHWFYSTSQLTPHTLLNEKIAEAFAENPQHVHEEKEMFEDIVKLSQTPVTKLMTPRVSVYAIDIRTSFGELLQKIIDGGFSRMPVYSKTLDSIQGVLYAKDMLAHIEKPAHFRWQSCIRPALFVPATKKTDHLLEDFQKSKNHLAVIIDEYGGTQGIITIEDILEEIVGEIDDELDNENDNLYKKIDEQTFVFDAKIALHDVCKILNFNENFFSDLQSPAESLAGLLLEIKGEIPTLNEVLYYKHVRCEISAASDKCIQKITVTLNGEQEDKANQS
ncbi:MAG: CBS domain-containing protein [Bacteroidales bacterium]|jgi:CBS domain containing-hemolysin-like protein|nr:CBS domain-containing protein [Bacteroidales bacterium]